MSPRGRLPTPNEVGTLLADLLDRDVHVAMGSSASSWEAIAGFAADDGVIVAACLCDLNLAATLGAALALMPSQAAKAAIEAGGLPEALSGNFREVVNVTAGLLSRVGPHVKLSDVVFAPSVPAADLASMVAAPLDHLDLDISVRGYEPGKMALMVR
jgi:hypothetical protein